MADRIIDPSTFSIPALARELRYNATRHALAYNAYGTSTVFLVRVLTPPAPVGTVVSSEFYEAMYSGHFGSGRFSFKGRIIAEPGRPSPHNFLPDPCAVNVASNTLKSAQLISLHTTFESPSGYRGPVPRMGDLVRVNLQPAAQGPFSLQKAFFDSLEAKKNPTAAVVAANVECSSLLSELWSAETPPGGSPSPVVPRSHTLHSGDNLPIAYVPVAAGVFSSAYDLNRLHPVHRVRRPHYGIDIAGSEGSSITMPMVGYVIKSGHSSTGGFSLVTAHPFRSTGDSTTHKYDKILFCRYLHLLDADRLAPSIDVVREKTVIAKMGNTGDGTGHHLHFEAHIANLPPEWMSANNTWSNEAGPTKRTGLMIALYYSTKGTRRDPIQVLGWSSHFTLRQSVNNAMFSNWQ